jgi:hypothetical protein
MDAGPPPLPPREKFTLPPLAWVAWLVFAGVRFGILFATSPAPSAYQVGSATGHVLGGFLLGAIVAWVVWKYGGRSRKLTTAAFAGALATSGLGLLGIVGMERAQQFQRRIEASAEIRKIGAETQSFQAKQRAAAARGEKVDERAGEDLARRTAAQMDALAKNSSGQQRATAEAGKAYMDGLLAAKTRYERASAPIIAGGVWDLAQLASAEDVEKQRAVVQEFADANAEFARYHDESVTMFRREMEKRQLPAKVIDEEIAGAKRQAGQRLAFIAKIRALDADIAQTLLSYIDLAADNIGKTTANAETGKLQFTEVEARTRQNELLTHAQEIGQQQLEYQQRLFKVK